MRIVLVLFDIDGTLLVTRGVGISAVLQSCREIFGREVESEARQFSGGMDPLIWRELCARHGFSGADAHHDRFRARYRELLEERLRAPGASIALPGVADLLRALAADGRLSLGLLTGNYPETGRMKIAAAGLDPELFEVAAWGIDGSHRRDLPRVAVERLRERTGRAVAGPDVLVIGDTPKDVDCAQAWGCRSLAVATGLYGMAELAAAGADRVVADLGDVRGIAEWITAPLCHDSRN